MDSGVPSLASSLPSGEVQAFYDDLNGKQYINEVYKFSVDKLYDLLFTESQFMRDFLELRRFSGEHILSKRISNPDVCKNSEPEVCSLCLVYDWSLPFSTGVVYHPWKKEEMGDQSREIMYTIAITNPLAPKTATVTETQVTSQTLESL